MGAEMVDGSIFNESTGEVPTPTEPFTVTQSGDNSSTGEVPFPEGPVVTGSHWGDVVARSTTQAADRPQPIKSRNKSVQPAAAEVK